MLSWDFGKRSRNTGSLACPVEQASLRARKSARWEACATNQARSLSYAARLSKTIPVSPPVD
jgi:hypothetical protein